MTPLNWPTRKLGPTTEPKITTVSCIQSELWQFNEILNLSHRRHCIFSRFFELMRYILNLNFLTPKGTSLAENASFDVQIDKICPAVFAVGDDKKKEGNEREDTQSHKTLHFSSLWGGHPWTDSHKIWRACIAPCDIIIMSSFCNKIFRGFRST